MPSEMIKKLKSNVWGAVLSKSVDIMFIKFSQFDKIS